MRAHFVATPHKTVLREREGEGEREREREREREEGEIEWKEALPLHVCRRCGPTGR
jgi:hypothetical protein